MSDIHTESDEAALERARAILAAEKAAAESATAPPPTSDPLEALTREGGDLLRAQAVIDAMATNLKPLIQRGDFENRGVNAEFIEGLSNAEIVRVVRELASDTTPRSRDGNPKATLADLEAHGVSFEEAEALGLTFETPGESA